jgi:hypothetical protein
MMYKFKCKKCGHEGKLDAGDMTPEQVKNTLEGWDSFDCPGRHVELTSPLIFWDIDWDNPIDEKSPTEEEWLLELKKKYPEVWSHDEVQKEFEVLDFMMGMMRVKHKVTGLTEYLTWATSPQGHRYYHR